MSSSILLQVLFSIPKGVHSPTSPALHRIADYYEMKWNTRPLLYFEFLCRFEAIWTGFSILSYSSLRTLVAPLWSRGSQYEDL